MPRLWILSPGRPRQVMDALGFAPMTEEGWPAGFWKAAPGLHVHLVVLRELPESRETLLLRLLGRGRTFFNAIDDLHALPGDTWEAELTIPLLLAFRVQIAQTDEEGVMNQTNELRAIYEAWEKRIVHTAWKGGEEAGWKEGEEAGRKQNLRVNLGLVYQARFGTLPSEVQAAVESMEDIDTLQQWVVPFATATPEQIAALVRGR